MMQKSWEMTETCTWVLIWECSARAFNWIPTWQGSDGYLDVPELSVNYLPAAGWMTPLIKYCDFAANFHLYSFLPELPGTLRQSTWLTVTASFSWMVKNSRTILVRPSIAWNPWINDYLKYQNHSDNSGVYQKCKIMWTILVHTRIEVVKYKMTG